MVYAPPRPGMGRGLSRAKREKRRGCHYCNTLEPQTVDHIVPRSLGGPDSDWNLVPSCQRCNTDKADHWPTCSCEKCQQAAARFLSDTAKMDNAVSVLQERIERYTVGIGRLMNRRGATENLLRKLEAHQDKH